VLAFLSVRCSSPKSFHVTLFAANLRGRADTSSTTRFSAGGRLTDDARRDQRVGARFDVAAANTAATVLGRRASRPLPSARAMMERERDCRRSGSVAAAAAAAAETAAVAAVASTLDCTSLSLSIASDVHNTVDFIVNYCTDRVECIYRATCLDEI